MMIELMQPYYSTPKRIVALLDELESWEGTPFTSQMAVKGVGVDCIRFSHAAHHNVGACGPVQWPRYKTVSIGDRYLKLLCDSIEASANVQTIWTRQEDGLDPDFAILWPGDILIISSGEGWHHSAIYAGWPWFWHCLRGKKVQRNRIDDSTWLSGIYRVYRIMEPANPSTLYKGSAE